MSKKTMVRLSLGGHVAIALVLCDLAQSIIARIILLVAIGIIAGIQSACIREIQVPEKPE